MHDLLGYLRETQMDLGAFLIDHVVLALDAMDIDDAEDFELTEEWSKQQFGSAVGNKDASIANANGVPTMQPSQLHGLTASISHRSGAP